MTLNELIAVFLEDGLGLDTEIIVLDTCNIKRNIDNIAEDGDNIVIYLA